MVGVHRSQPPRADLPLQVGTLGLRPGQIDALAGDVETAAREILKGLDCERRAGSVGPQVLQLIKPRA
ncbi:MAG: hypothetical protein EBR33_01440 [Synechococcaceae bacterium WB4_1_0192]|nr:hypothetical protein [Synechococcaceae bacterium WB4_1_0192]